MNMSQMSVGLVGGVEAQPAIAMPARTTRKRLVEAAESFTGWKLYRGRRSPVKSRCNADTRRVASQV